MVLVDELLPLARGQAAIGVVVLAQAPPSLRRHLAKAPPAEPPAKLAEAPELFVDMSIIRNLDKLTHFEAIQTTTLDDEPATPDGQEPPSNG